MADVDGGLSKTSVDQLLILPCLKPVLIYSKLWPPEDVQFTLPILPYILIKSLEVYTIDGKLITSSTGVETSLTYLLYNCEESSARTIATTALNTSKVSSC
jgi:hypothetical protein